MNPSNVSMLKSCRLFRKVSQLYQRYTPSPFLIMIQDFFNNYEATGKPDWDCLMSALGKFDAKYAGNQTDPFYEFLFGLLNELKCQESFALQFSLHRFYLDRLITYGYNVYDGEARLLRRNRQCRKHIPIYFLDCNIKFENMVIDLHPFFLHDYQAYRNFVRFGFNINLNKAERFYFMLDILRSLKSFEGQSIFLEWYPIQVTGINEWNESVQTLMSLMSKFPSTEFWNRRVALAIVIVDSLVQFYHIDSKESLYSLQLLFRTITDAYLTLDEMTGIMEILLERQDDKEKVVQIYCEIYKELFPKTTMPLQPRSLKHLCRVQIRQCMKGANALHFGVTHLDIPQTLENYLLLEE